MKFALAILEKHLRKLEKDAPCKGLALGKKQERFSFMLIVLFLKMYSEGYAVRCGDVFARDGHIPESCHYKKLAVDVNLFKDSVWMTKTEDHTKFGEYWESFGGSWGGRFRDGNHYSIEDAGSK